MAQQRAISTTKNLIFSVFLSFANTALAWCGLGGGTSFGLAVEVANSITACAQNAALPICTRQLRRTHTTAVTTISVSTIAEKSGCVAIDPGSDEKVGPAVSTNYIPKGLNRNNSIRSIPPSSAVLNVRNFAASGSSNSYIGNIKASSRFVVLTSASDFLKRQGVAVIGAGTTTPLTAFSAPSSVAIISAHTTVNGNQATSSILTVATTSGFLSSGTIIVPNSLGATQVITYTGTTATTMTGASGWIGTLDNSAVVQQIPASNGPICYQLLAGDPVEGMTPASPSTCYAYGPTTRPSTQFG